jgi:hypothetical protein
MSPAKAKREPSMSVAIAAIVKAGLCPRLERRTDGSWVLTGQTAEQLADEEEADHRARMARVREAERAKVAAIQEAQAGIIHHLLWMLTVVSRRERL